MSIVASGDWWALDSDGLLTVSIVGDMPDYAIPDDAPWYSRRASVKSICVSESVTRIGRNAFNGFSNSSFKTVELPNSVTSVWECAFYDCSRLQRVALPNSVSSLGEAAFYNCPALTAIWIPNGVASIPTWAFYNCNHLTSVKIPSSVANIETSAFKSCSRMTSVTIPNSVTTIESEAFDGCNALTDVYYTGTQTQWNAITIESGNGKLTSATRHYHAPLAPESIASPEITVGSVGKPLAAVAGAHNQLTRAFEQLRGNVENIANRAGTVSGIVMNGESKGTSGVVDLGSVVTSAVKFTNASAVTVDGSDYYGTPVLQISYAETTGDNVEVHAEIPLTVTTATVGSDEGGWALAEAVVEARLRRPSPYDYFDISGAGRKRWTLGDGTHTLSMQWQVGASALRSPSALALTIERGAATVAAGDASALVSGITVSQGA